MPINCGTRVDGRPVTRDAIGDMSGFARDLAVFLLALQDVDPTGGPPAGAHSFSRGAWPGVYDSETRAAIDTLAPDVDADAATEV